MKKIFAPWRAEYIEDGTDQDGCIFCDHPEEDEDEEYYILYRGDKAFVMLNTYPYNPGHLLIAPYRHVGSYTDLEDEEFLEIMKISKLFVKAIREVMEPDGFNMGFNIGRTAGAGIDDHVHYHVVPRWNGDTNFMPILSDTKVISESLERSYNKIKEKVEELDVGI